MSIDEAKQVVQERMDRGLLVLNPMELPFIASKEMKELPLEETSEDDLLGQPGAKAWETKIQ